MLGPNEAVFVTSLLPMHSSYQNVTPAAATSSISLPGGATSVAQQFFMPIDGSFSFIRFPCSFTNAGTGTTLGTSNASMNASVNLSSTYNVGLYTVGTGASSRSLMSYATSSLLAVMQQSMSVTGAGTQYSQSYIYTFGREGTTTTFSTTTARSTSNYSFTSGAFTDFTANRYLDIPFAASVSRGPYWLVFGSSTSSSANSTGISNASGMRIVYSYNAAQSGGAFPAYGVMGSTNLTSANNFQCVASFSTAGGGTTTALPISALSSSATNNAIIFQMLRSA